MKKTLVILLAAVMLSSCTIIGGTIGAAAPPSASQKLEQFTSITDLKKLGKPSFQESITQSNGKPMLMVQYYRGTASAASTLEIGNKTVTCSNTPSENVAYYEFHIVDQQVVYAKNFGIDEGKKETMKGAVNGAAIGFIIDAVLIVKALSDFHFL